MAKGIEEVAQADLERAQKALDRAQVRIDGKDNKPGLAGKAEAAANALEEQKEKVATLTQEVRKAQGVLDHLAELNKPAAQVVPVDGIDSEESVQAI